MVLTDLPFERPSLIQSRYAIIRRPGSDPHDKKDEEDKKEESKEYAAFLRDANKQKIPKRKTDQDKKFSSPSASAGAKFTYTTAARYERSSKSDRGTEDEAPPTVVDLALQVEKDKKGYEKRIKVIEDHMWQHKQEERELKRAEGDIVKNQRAVRKSIRDMEQAIARKRFAEEKRLNVGLEKYTRLQRDFVHNKEENTRQRTDKSQNFDQANKDKDRKVLMATSDLARKYKTKFHELDLREAEIRRINTDFETKLRIKEEEQYLLKQELAELAIALNMEAQKGRQIKVDSEKERRKEIQSRIDEDKSHESALNNKLMKSQGDVKNADMTRRKLSSDLTLTKAHLAIKAREEGRHLQDTHIKLEDNRATQRSLNNAALHAEMDLKNKKIEHKIQSTELRRTTMMNRALKEKKERDVAQEEVMSQRFQRRYNDQRRREHEDALKHFQKRVRKSEEIENDLFSKVRNNEYARQKKEQDVRRIQSKLEEMKRQNAVKLKQEMVDCENKEKDLEQKLIREQAELAKVHAQREESYVTLQKHRALMQEEKHHAAEHEKEHERLIRIGARSEMILA